MPNIKPVSDLRNYNEVLNDIAVGEPVFLTKNGRGRYAILDIKEYEKLLDRYFGLKFTDIVDNPDFRHHVLSNFIDESQELVEFLINEVYPQCKPFCDLSHDLIQKREKIYHSNCEGNPGRLEPYLRMKRHYNETFGEGYMETFLNELDLGYADKAKCNTAAEPWNYDTFVQHTKKM